jgi:hydrogenase/urease accessory protein HupE
MIRAAAALLALALGVLLADGSALAHDARPLAVSIVEQSEGLYRVAVQPPPTLASSDAPRILWPEQCDAPDGGDQVAGAARGVGVSLLACLGGIDGGVIAIDYPGANPSLTALIRVERLDGSTSTTVLPPDQTSWTVPPRPNWRSVARDYIGLGFRHIWEGPDHLMFVAGLLMLARRPRRILLAVTGFTAAHSITLTLATLGLVRLPIPAVEAMIALSILFLAGELARKDSQSFSRRFPVALSFVFGLLHGFGFASALGEIGLPPRELAAGLLSFNIGVELGQLAFVAAAGLVMLAWLQGRRLAGQALQEAVARRAGLVGAYLLGVPAALWFVERTAAAF